jgi:hypothetical protein
METNQPQPQTPQSFQSSEKTKSGFFEAQKKKNNYEAKSDFFLMFTCSFSIEKL